MPKKNKNNKIILLRKLKEAFLDILFPRSCFGCGREGSYLCQDCQSCLDISEDVFCLCSIPRRLVFSSNMNSAKCGRCLSKKLNGLFFPLSYQNNLIKELIRQFKYDPFVKELAKPLAELIIAHLNLIDKEVWKNKILIPVPLHKKRLKQRGFNQAEEIAKELAKKLNISLLVNCLKKVKITSPQAKLSEKEREKNIKGAFLTKNHNLIQGKRILLVDDVYTTGATMEEAAKVLKQAGAKEVWGVVVAREPLKN